MRLLPLLALPALTLAAHIRITLGTSQTVPDPSTLPPSTAASLTAPGHSYVAPLDINNAFDFRNVTPGSYLLDITGPSHMFPAVRLDVYPIGYSGSAEESVAAWPTMRGGAWEHKGEAYEVTQSGKGVWGFEVRAGPQKEYFVERAGFRPLDLLKNPMILMAGVAALMMFGMPKLMESMDDETRAEFEERQKSNPLNGMFGGGAASKSAGFDAASWLAGTTTPSSGGKNDAVAAPKAAQAKGGARQQGVTR